MQLPIFISIRFGEHGLKHTPDRKLHHVEEYLIRHDAHSPWDVESSSTKTVIEPDLPALTCSRQGAQRRNSTRPHACNTGALPTHVLDLRG